MIKFLRQIIRTLIYFYSLFIKMFYLYNTCDVNKAYLGIDNNNNCCDCILHTVLIKLK